MLFLYATASNSSRTKWSRTTSSYKSTRLRPLSWQCALISWLGVSRLSIEYRTSFKSLHPVVTLQIPLRKVIRWCLLLLAWGWLQLPSACQPGTERYSIINLVPVPLSKLFNKKCIEVLPQFCWLIPKCSLKNTKDWIIWWFVFINSANSDAFTIFFTIKNGRQNEILMTVLLLLYITVQCTATMKIWLTIFFQLKPIFSTHKSKNYVSNPKNSLKEDLGKNADFIMIVWTIWWSESFSPNKFTLKGFHSMS